MADLTLPINPGKILTDSKLKSLSEKYFSIPECYLKYYPKYEKKKAKHKAIKKMPGCAKRKIDNNKIPIIKKRAVGRPKSQPKIAKGVKSITTYYCSQ